MYWPAWFPNVMKVKGWGSSLLRGRFQECCCAERYSRELGAPRSKQCCSEGQIPRGGTFCRKSAGQLGNIRYGPTLTGLRYKIKAVSVYAITAYGGGRGGLGPLNRNLFAGLRNGSPRGPSRFTSEERAPDSYWTGGRVGLRTGLDILEKGKISYHCRELNPGK